MALSPRSHSRLSLNLFSPSRNNIEIYTYVIYFFDIFLNVSQNSSKFNYKKKVNILKSHRNHEADVCSRRNCVINRKYLQRKVLFKQVLHHAPISMFTLSNFFFFCSLSHTCQRAFNVGYQAREALLISRNLLRRQYQISAYLIQLIRELIFSMCIS